MENNTIKKNAILNITYNILNIIFPLITFPYVSRILRVEGLGNVTFFSTLANYAIMFGSLGISTYGIRAVSRVRDNKKELSKTTLELLIINTVATIIVIIALLVSCLFVTKFANEPTLLLINIGLIFATPFGMNWLYSGLEQYGYITKRSIAVKTVSLCLVFLFVKGADDYCCYAAIVAFSTIGAYILNVYHSRKFVSFRGIEHLNYKKHMKPMLILFASSLAISVYINLDTLMLGFICGDGQVGLYTVAVKVKSLLLIAVNAISTVLLPRLSYYLVNEKIDEFNKILEKSISIIVMISASFAAFFMIEAKDSVLVLSGQEYIDATSCMIIIMPILLISGFSNIIGNQVLIPMGKEECFMKAVILGAIIDLILNFILMPKFGCIGAAIATLLAEVTQMSVQLFYSREQIISAIQVKTTGKILISLFIASFITIITSSILHLYNLLNIVVMGFVFFGTYIAVLLILKERLVLEVFNAVMKRMK